MGGSEILMIKDVLENPLTALTRLFSTRSMYLTRLEELEKSAKVAQTNLDKLNREITETTGLIAATETCIKDTSKRLV
jgi:hypothetical protein